MDGVTQSAVDSLLGQLTNLLISEVQLVAGVRDDVQFIKDEMESMNGFLLDMANGGGGSGEAQPGHQVKAWRKQVREVAYDSQRCMDRYVQITGASRSSAGLLGSVGRVPQLLRTRRVAKQIKDIKTRARDVGERRQRYGVVAPAVVATPPGAMPGSGVGVGRARPLSPLQLQAEEARRRRAIADAADWLDVDASQVMDWLRTGNTTGAGAQRHGHLRRWYDAVTGFATNMLGAQSKIDQLGPEIVKMVMALHGHDHPENIEDAAALLWDQNLKVMKGELHMVLAVLKRRLGLHRHTPQPATAQADQASVSSLPEDQHDKKKIKQAATTGADKLLNAARTAADQPEEMFRAEMQYSVQLTEWLKEVLSSGGIIKQLLFSGGSRYPRLLAIVTPPFDAQSVEGDELPVDKRATELAWRVYTDCLQGCPFHYVIWINAKDLAKPRERLERLLQEVRKQLHPQSSHDDGQMSTWDEERLQQEIKKHLSGKQFLIVLADHKDNTPWLDIIPALPRDFSDKSTILVTPMIQQTTQYHGWYIVSLIFAYLHKTSNYKVHYYSHLGAASNKAYELLKVASSSSKSSDQHELAALQGTAKEILKKCRWDTFSTKMFLHALYANPHRSNGELGQLLLCLDEFSTGSNAQEMISLCYDDLASHYKTCFLYLSIFPRDSEIRRTSLVRRWAAEGLVTRRGRQTATDEAEECVSALLDRGLVLPAGNNDPPTARVKMCKVHPHVFSFITRMLREDCGADNSDLPPALAHRLSIPSGIKLPKKTEQAGRWKKQKGRTGAAGPQGSIEDMVTLLNSFPTSQLGWIKVLDLEGYRGLKKQHLKNICKRIFQLKYLSLRNTGLAELPKEIGRLQDLETFDIRQTKIKSFPAKSVVLPNLEHLLANHSGNDGNGSGEESFSTISIPREIGSMTNIQILSHVQVSGDADEDALNDVVRLQHLRKLGVVIHGKAANLLQVIGMLNESLCTLSIHIKDGVNVDLTNTSATFSAPRSLSSLEIYARIPGLPNWISDLQLLSKITLCRTSLTESDIKILGDLVNLCFINLRHIQYSNKNNLPFKKGFKKLEVLTVVDSNISGVSFEQKACPRLEKIVWTSSSCKIETLAIHELRGLKEIELQGSFDLTSIKKSVEANKNNPKLKYKQTHVDTAAAAATASAISSAK